VSLCKYPRISQGFACTTSTYSAGTFKPLAVACGALASELTLAQQQQKPQPASSLKGGFFSAANRQQQAKKPSKPQQQQQQQRRPSDNILRGLTLGRILITLWEALVRMPAGSNDNRTLFSNADQCASALPASKLMLVLLQAQQHTASSATTATGSSSNNSGGATTSSTSSSSSATDWSWMVAADEPAKQVQAALAAATTLAEAIATGPRKQWDLQPLPGVMPLLAMPELHQLLIATAAWLAGLLHQQKQGIAAVPVESVLRCLSNSSAAAAVTLDGSSSSDALGSSAGSSSSSSVSSSRVPPHHSRVLELLQVSAIDPLHACGLAHALQPSPALNAVSPQCSQPSMPSMPSMQSALNAVNAVSPQCSQRVKCSTNQRGR
jgi:hypothetical protein